MVIVVMGIYSDVYDDGDYGYDAFDDSKFNIIIVVMVMMDMVT